MDGRRRCVQIRDLRTARLRDGRRSPQPERVVARAFLCILLCATPACQWAPTTAAADAGSGAISSEAPAWTGKKISEQGDAVYGVGSVRGIRNLALARTTAANRARAAVVRHLRAKGPLGKQPVANIEIVEHWTDSSSGAMFARARWIPATP